MKNQMEDSIYAVMQTETGLWQFSVGSLEDMAMSLECLAEYEGRDPNSQEVQSTILNLTMVIVTGSGVSV